MILYDSPFSPFARKVRLVLAYKGLAVEVIDGLDHSNIEQLKQVNGRAEVPALVDGDCVIVNSADIVAYLEHKYPQQPVLPSCPKSRANARRWERMADTLVDAIMVDISYWQWAQREDSMPAGMLAAAREDLSSVYQQLEQSLQDQEYLCGELSIADFALFPHLAAAGALQVPYAKETYPRLAQWMARLKQGDIFQDDLQRIRDCISGVNPSEIELNKIFWRGDRIEWVLARGFEDWFINEIKTDKVIWPPQKMLTQE